ncbi:MAG: tetratricopeptide repeat protein [Myxococcaceae bacterium]
MATSRTEHLEPLARGSNLLAAGQLAEAKTALEQAHQLAPKNEKAQNLLGLTYFKLGEFDNAARIYGLLIRENPTDPTLHVNLGLVYLKSGETPKAVRSFETATDLAPEHTKAHNYLGLALAQARDYARAREHFVLAGSQAMADKMSRAAEEEARAQALAEQANAQAAEAPIELMAEDEARMSEQGVEEISAVADNEELRFAEDEGPSAPPISSSPVGAQAAPAAPTFADPAIAAPPMAAPRDVTPYAPPAADEPNTAASSHDAFAYDGGLGAFEVPPESLELRPADAWRQSDAFQPESPPAMPPPSQPSDWQDVAPVLGGQGLRTPRGFEVGHEVAVIPVHGEVYARLEGLLSASGELDIQLAARCVQGRFVDEVFGDHTSRMSRVSGIGRLWIHSRKHALSVMRLGEGSIYIREERLIAFEASLRYENGRLSGLASLDVPLVHLTGEGEVLVDQGGGMRSLPVLGDSPVRVSLAQWVGWQGRLTPRLLGPEDGLGAGWVEFVGEGQVLLCLPVE